jgi:hypothetical protein
MSFLDPDLVAGGARRSVLLGLLPRLIARELFPLTSVFGEESLNKSGYGRSALNFGGQKRVCIPQRRGTGLRPAT